MRYYRVRTGYAQLEPGEGFAGDQDLANDSDIWPASSGQPFVLVTRKPWRPPTDIMRPPAMWSSRWKSRA